MVSHHLAIFGGHWSSASGNMQYVNIQVTSQNHVTERSSNFMSGRLSLCTSLVAKFIVAVEMF